MKVSAPRSTELPDVLLGAIANDVETKWKADLLEKGSSEGWLLGKTIAWIDRSFLTLLRLKPELIEHYIGCDNEGCSQRRFTILSPTEVVRDNGSSSSSSGVDPEQAERAAQYYAQKEMERLAKLEEEDRKKKADGARIRVSGSN